MERRLAAILVADVVGYTRLMGDDETGTLDNLKRIRDDLICPIIAQHNGRIVKLMGDGLLVEFASIIDAVKCARAWQQAVSDNIADSQTQPPIHFRIGLNLGDVIVDGEDLYGNGVNIASRLEALADPGGICLSGDAYRQAKGKIDIEFHDMGLQKLKNVLDPVQVYKTVVAGSRDEASTVLESANNAQESPSIAVLPLKNMSGDADQELLADGISEEIITTLSKVPSLLVIARNSTFEYKSRNVDVKQVGREQGVRYVLEGSIRKSGNRVRISIQLIDTESAVHVWADRYDREIDDIFQLQDEIALRVASELQGELTEGEMARIRGGGTSNLDAWVEQMRAVAGTRLVTRESYAEARRSAERAIQIDPDYAAPRCILSFICTVEARWGFHQPRDAAIAEAREHIAAALEIDPHNAEAYGVLGFVNSLERNHEEAIGHFKTALEINPNHADVSIRLAITYAFNGQVEEGVRVAETAIKLNPKYPGFYAGIYGFTLRMAGRIDDAIKAFREYGQKVPGFGHVDLAIIYADRNELEAAHREAEQVLAHAPDFSISKWAGTQLHADDAVLKRDVDALRKAGLPA